MLNFCSDEVIRKEKKFKKPSIGSYNYEKAEAVIYRPTVRRR